MYYLFIIVTFHSFMIADNIKYVFYTSKLHINFSKILKYGKVKYRKNILYVKIILSVHNLFAVKGHCHGIIAIYDF